jgi:hypothetical protein
VLNRVIRWTREVWEYEADQRHVEILLREMGFKKARVAKAVGEDEKKG